MQLFAYMQKAHFLCAHLVRSNFLNLWNESTEERT